MPAESLIAQSMRINSSQNQRSNVLGSFLYRQADYTGVNRYLRTDNLSTFAGEGAIAQAIGSCAYGAYASALHQGALAFGTYARAHQSSAIAIGDQSNVIAYRGIGIGVRCQSSGIRAIVLGTLARGTALDVIVIGTSSIVSAFNGIAIGNDSQVKGSNGIGIGVGTRINVNGTTSSGIGIGGAAAVSVTGGIAIGANSACDGLRGIVIGYAASITSGDPDCVVIGYEATSTVTGSIVLGRGANCGVTRQFLAGSTQSWIVDHTLVMGENNQQWAMKVKSEIIVVAASAYTDSTITIPQYAQVFAVSARVTTVIPTATTFTVRGATSGAGFNNATSGISTAVGTTDPGTNAGYFVEPAAEFVRITPNAIPVTGTGEVRITIYYIEVTPPTS